MNRPFSREFFSNLRGVYLLNEAAVTRLGLTSPEDAVGKAIEFDVERGRVVGVVKDFHMKSLHQTIAPMIIGGGEYVGTFISIRIRPDNFVATLDFINEKWKEINPDHPFTYTFLDEDFEALYRDEEKMGGLLGAFCLMAVFIACLGLFGLAAFTARQRTREIGIRKVLGASESGMVLLLAGEFIKLVLLANVIAWPIAWLIMRTWLQNFAYHVDMGADIFVLSGVLALLLALVTVGYQAVKAGLANPVNSLRYE